MFHGYTIAITKHMHTGRAERMSNRRRIEILDNRRKRNDDALEGFGF